MIIWRNSETHRKRDAEKVRLTLLKEIPSSHIRESQHRNRKQRQTTRKLRLGIIDSSSIFAPPRVVYNASLWPFEFTLSPSTWTYCSSTRCLHYRSLTSAHDPMNPWARITLWQHYEFIVSCNDEYECGMYGLLKKGTTSFSTRCCTMTTNDIRQGGRVDYTHIGDMTAQVWDKLLLFQHCVEPTASGDG